MVKLQGKGAFQGVNMIVHVPDNGIIKGEDGKPVEIGRASCRERV